MGERLVKLGRRPDRRCAGAPPMATPSNLVPISNERQIIFSFNKSSGRDLEGVKRVSPHGGEEIIGSTRKFAVRFFPHDCAFNPARSLKWCREANGFVDQ